MSAATRSSAPSQKRSPIATAAPTRPGSTDATACAKDLTTCTQLREKQKARRIYGLLEKQFRNLDQESSRQPGITGENLLRATSSCASTTSRPEPGWGREPPPGPPVVRHGHVVVNGSRVTIPSYRVRKDDQVTLKDATRQNFSVRRNMDTLERTTPAWLKTGDAGFSVAVLNPPLREHIDEPVQEQLIVELYSK